MMHPDTPAPLPRSPRLCDVMLHSARQVQAVLAGRSLSDELAETPATVRAAVQAVSFHVMRRLGLAGELRRLMVKHPPADALFDALLQVALVLLESALAAEETKTRNAGDENPQCSWDGGIRPPHHEPVYAVHTVVDQAVRAAHGMPAYKNLLNACLRRYGRERIALKAQACKRTEARWNFPAWWVGAVRKAYPQDWQAILTKSNQPAPMTLRVNRRQISMKDLSAALTQTGIAHKTSGQTTLTLARPVPVTQIPGFEQGWWSVQDASAQLAAQLLAPRDGERVLDACAAPGGKTTHLLELADVQVLALDENPQRLVRVRQNLQRLQWVSNDNAPNVVLKCADAAQVQDWWDGQPFDAVLADVPCTASGVVRRHPDVRWLKRFEDVARTAAQQRRIVDALWQTVKPGGRMLYASCSVFPEEGEMQAQRFVRTHTDARRMPAAGQILPGGNAAGTANSGDGFFYALFVKDSEHQGAS